MEESDSSAPEEAPSRKKPLVARKRPRSTSAGGRSPVRAPRATRAPALEEEPLPSELKTRLGGLALIGIGALFAKFFIFDVLAAAEAHATEVSTAFKGTALAVVFPVLGLILLVGGPPVAVHFRWGRDGKGTTAGYAIGIVLGIVGIATHIAMEQHLSALGYK